MAGERPKENFERALGVVRALQSANKLPESYRGLPDALEADIQGQGP
jgi:hypothetical protein